MYSIALIDACCCIWHYFTTKMLQRLTFIICFLYIIIVMHGWAIEISWAGKHFTSQISITFLCWFYFGKLINKWFTGNLGNHPAIMTTRSRKCSWWMKHCYYNMLSCLIKTYFIYALGNFVMLGGWNGLVQNRLMLTYCLFWQTNKLELICKMFSRKYIWTHSLLNVGNFALQMNWQTPAVIHMAMISCLINE